MESSIELTAEFKQALKLCESGLNVFISGVAGTGKSTLLKLLTEGEQDNVVVLAPTGIAALQVHGMTIHSFFRFPTHILQHHDIKFNGKLIKILKTIRRIIIDEISMVRADLFDAIDTSLKLNRNSNKPFGGVQLIVFGDMFQLPPVVSRTEAEFFSTLYRSPYFFESTAYLETNFAYVELTKIFRQKDKKFQDMLNHIRDDTANRDILAAFNSRYTPCEQNSSNDPTLTLCSTNKNANEINESRLAALTGPEYIYTAEVQGLFEEKSYPTNFKMRLKVGAQVMLIRNDSELQRWYNGTLATVSELGEDSIIVEIRRKKYAVGREEWEAVQYIFDEQTRRVKPTVVGIFKQFPLRLAWAVTIHKSQGLSLNQVRVDLGRGAFAHGQTYVALSRCRSFEGLTLKSKLRPQDILVDHRVCAFMKNFKTLAP